MPTPEPTQTGQYHKVLLKNVKLWEPCSPRDATEWLHPLDDSDGHSKPYPIKQLHLNAPSIPRLYVIVQPDGAIWTEGSLYLFHRAAELDASEATISNVAGDLAQLMNTLAEGGIDPDHFPAQKNLRPTYYYKAHVKTLMAKGEVKRKTANRKMHSQVGFYRWKVACRRFKPENDMWLTLSAHIRYVDKHGVTQVKEVISTDMIFKTAKTISTGRFIRDGGKLFPISRDNQMALIQALGNLGNPEMLIIHIVGLTSGARIQSVLTLRHSSVIFGIGSENDPDKYSLHGIEMGGDSLVETKNSKPQTVLVPAWVHYMLAVYTNSQRHKDRATMSPISDETSQYVFLTRTGRPYYTAEIDQHLFGYAAEKGSAIRQFLIKVHKELTAMNAEFTYHFHDLRATFGMNLIEDNIDKIETGKMNQLELIDMLRKRLNQESLDVTMEYLKYREDHPRIAIAQSDMEIHLENLIKVEMNKHEQGRTEHHKS